MFPDRCPLSVNKCFARRDVSLFSERISTVKLAANIHRVRGNIAEKIFRLRGQRSRSKQDEMHFFINLRPSVRWPEQLTYNGRRKRFDSLSYRLTCLLCYLTWTNSEVKKNDLVRTAICAALRRLVAEALAGCGRSYQVGCCRLTHASVWYSHRGCLHQDDSLLLLLLLLLLMLQNSSAHLRFTSHVYPSAAATFCSRALITHAAAMTCSIQCSGPRNSELSSFLTAQQHIKPTQMLHGE